MKPTQLRLFQKARELPNAKVRVVSFSGESHVLQFLIFIFACTIAAYLYFVGVSIMNVIDQKQASSESERLQSKVGELEQEYFALSKSITVDRAEALGLVQTSHTAFVNRAGGVAMNVGAKGI